MKILVCGGRDYRHRSILYAVLTALHGFNPIDALIHGGAKGADLLAADWAFENGVIHKAYEADWDEHGRSAGPIRNKQMLDDNKDLDLVVAFAGGRGTANMIEQAKKAKVKVIQI